MTAVPLRTYIAKQFEVAVGELSEQARDGFKISGTLDGYIDFAVTRATYQLSLDEARALAAALNGAIRDVTANCLYDHDVLLAPKD